MVVALAPVNSATFGLEPIWEPVEQDAFGALEVSGRFVRVDNLPNLALNTTSGLDLSTPPFVSRRFSKVHEGPRTQVEDSGGAETTQVRTHSTPK